jgi:flagellar secretion chaperone FliS
MSTSVTLSPSTESITFTNPETITPYQVITLLLDGALERIDQAINRLSDGDADEASILVQKAIGIVGGLRESLNLSEGGEIADNLDALYEYIVQRLESINDDKPLIVLEEVKNLLQEVYSGWDGISTSVK